MTEAHIIITGEEAWYEQGGVRFAVDRHDLCRTLGAASFNRDGSVFDRLPDSTLVMLALANDLPAEPFSRDLLRWPLSGILQETWWRDVEHKPITEYLLKNQADRVKRYLNALENLRLNPEAELEQRKPRHRESKLTRSYRFREGCNPEELRGLRRQVLELARTSFKSEVFTFAALEETARGQVQTKSKLTRVLTWLANELTRTGYLEPVGWTLPRREEEDNMTKKKSGNGKAKVSKPKGEKAAKPKKEEKPDQKYELKAGQPETFRSKRLGQIVTAARKLGKPATLDEFEKAVGSDFPAKSSRKLVSWLVRCSGAFKEA